MDKKNTIVVITGGFDPIHSGHIAYINAAAKLGDYLIVGVNSDEWLTRKKGKPFMSIAERESVVAGIKNVYHTIRFDDTDDTAKGAIVKVAEQYHCNRIIFANGGDRTEENIPEMDLEGYDLEFVFGVGGEDKKNSSSTILSNWDKPKVTRKWGSYRKLDSNGHWAVKELTFTQGKSLSDQRHFERSEHWHVVAGKILMELESKDGTVSVVVLHAGDSIDIPHYTWHKATCIGKTDSKVIEVWMGNNLSESDIERRD